MKLKKLLIYGLTCLIALPAIGQASHYNEDGYNPNSTLHIHTSDIMYRKTVTRALDLRTTQNKPLFARGHEITKLLINATKEGVITPYKTDSLKNEMTIEEFKKNMEIPNEEGELSKEQKQFGASDEGGGWGNDGKSSSSNKPQMFFPRDLYQLEIKEDVIFDNQRSRLYYDILAITLFVPADHAQNIKGIQMPICSYSYKEIKNKLFENNPKAIWYNAQNKEKHMNLAKAFKLRLFDSYIIKVSNPDNAYLTDIYGSQKKGIMGSRWAENEILNYESFLWSY